MKARILAAALLAACCSGAIAAPRVKVVESVKVDAPAAKVWARIGHFYDVSWHPAIKATLASDGDKLDSQRRLDLGGPALWEALMSHSDAARRYQYRMLDNGENQKVVPVSHYVATLEVKPSGQGSEVVWSSEFAPADGTKAEDARKAVVGVYRAGLDNIGKALSQN